MEEIKRKKVEKKSEIRQIFKNELNTYCDMEEKQLPKLFYILRYKALNYIYSSFGQIAERYSNVELPEYPNEMTRQFDNIMNSYLDIQEFNDILQQEVARFCQKINSTRTFYLQQVGRQNNFNWIVHFSPLHSFEYKYNMSYFHEIAGISFWNLRKKRLHGLAYWAFLPIGQVSVKHYWTWGLLLTKPNKKFS